MSIHRILGIVCTLLALCSCAWARTIHVDPSRGSDVHPGSSEQPLASLARAVELADAVLSSEDTTIVLACGVYVLDGTITLGAGRSTDSRGRLSVTAAHLPDDPGWTPALMPVILSVARPSVNFGFDCAVGVMVACDHVTLRGITFLGCANPETFYYYPVGRQDMKRRDLEVSQCLFLGGHDVLTVQAAICAHGDGVVVDHCIFHQCRNAVVFWKAEAPKRGNVMRCCIVDQAEETAIWTAREDLDFEFRNNVVTGCAFVWCRNGVNTSRYEAVNCLFAGNTCLLAENENSAPVQTKALFLTGVYRIREARVELVRRMAERVPRDYLHVPEGSPGAELGAGLFVKPGPRGR